MSDQESLLEQLINERIGRDHDFTEWYLRRVKDAADALADLLTPHPDSGKHGMEYLSSKQLMFINPVIESAAALVGPQAEHLEIREKQRSFKRKLLLERERLQKALDAVDNRIASL
jgi:hypothetical protein